VEQIINLKNITKDGLALANSLRLGYKAQSHELTIGFIDALSKIVEEESIVDDHLNQLFNIMLSAQQQGDLLYFADIIQYELLPHMEKILIE